MGNCNKSNFHIEDNVDQNSVNYLQLNNNFLQVFEKNNTSSKKDALIEFVERIIEPRYIRDMSNFKGMYRIKKNWKCQKDLIYQIKVIQNIRSGRLFNLKIITKEEIKFMQEYKFKKIFASEMRVLQTLKCRNIESLVNVYIDTSLNGFILYIVTNYTTRFSLLDEINKRIAEKKRFSKSEVASVVKFLAEILFNFKSEKFVFRNFSPDNIFLIKEGNLETLCVRNFYFSEFSNSDNKIRGMTGPLWYMAPEMLKDSFYDAKVDVWSCGMIIYTLLTLENPFIQFTTANHIKEIIRVNKCFKNISSLTKYGIEYSALNLTFKMLVENPNLRISPEVMLEDDYLKEISLIVDKGQFGNLLNSFDWKIVDELKLKIKNLKIMHDLVFYLFFNLKQYFIDNDENILFSNFFNYLDTSKDGLLRKSKIEQILLKDVELFGKNNIIRYIEILEVLLNNDLMNREVTKNPYLKDTINFEYFLVANILLKMYCDRKQDWVKKRIKIMYYELDVDSSNSISMDEIQVVLHQIPIKEYLKNNLKILLSDSYYNPYVIMDFNYMSINDLEKFLFYECVLLTEEKNEILA
jgi:serine/threonine protein kinase